MLKHILSKRVAAIVCSVGIATGAAVGVGISAAAPASAADNVPHNANVLQPSGPVATGNVNTNWNNTNCDPNSLNNCSGLNGALLRAITIRMPQAINQGRVDLCIDIYGDGTTSAVSTVSVNPSYDGIVDGRYQYKVSQAQISNATPFNGQINSLSVKVFAPTISNGSAVSNRATPYGSGYAGTNPVLPC